MVESKFHGDYLAKIEEIRTKRKMRLEEYETQKALKKIAKRTGSKMSNKVDEIASEEAQDLKDLLVS